VLLGGLADAGGGHLFDIETAEQIESVLARELGDALDVVWRDAWLRIDAPRGVHVQALGLSQGETQRGLVRLGDLVSEQVQDVLLELRFPQGKPQRDCRIEIPLEVEGQPLARAEQSWRWASHADNDRQPRRSEVDRRVAAYFANLARREAAVQNRLGDRHEASWRLHRTAQRILSYAGDDLELLQHARTLEQEAKDQRGSAKSISSMRRQTRPSRASASMGHS
jgi:hypothetical protein